MDDVPTLTFITSRVAMRFSADETRQNGHKQGGQVTDCMKFCCIPKSYYLRFYTITYQNLTLPRGVWIGKRVERPYKALKRPQPTKVNCGRIGMRHPENSTFIRSGNGAFKL